MSTVPFITVLLRGFYFEKVFQKLELRDTSSLQRISSHSLSYSLIHIKTLSL